LTSKVVDGGIREQTKQCLENLKEVLENADSGLMNVLKTTVFMKDMEDFKEMNEVYGGFFGEHKRNTLFYAFIDIDSFIILFVIYICSDMID